MIHPAGTEARLACPVQPGSRKVGSEVEWTESALSRTRVDERLRPSSAFSRADFSWRFVVELCPDGLLTPLPSPGRSRLSRFLLARRSACALFARAEFTEGGCPVHPRFRLISGPCLGPPPFHVSPPGVIASSPYSRTATRVLLSRRTRVPWRWSIRPARRSDRHRRRLIRGCSFPFAVEAAGRARTLTVRSRTTLRRTRRNDGARILGLLGGPAHRAAESACSTGGIADRPASCVSRNGMFRSQTGAHIASRGCSRSPHPGGNRRIGPQLSHRTGPSSIAASFHPSFLRRSRCQTKGDSHESSDSFCFRHGRAGPGVVLVRQGRPRRRCIRPCAQQGEAAGPDRRRQPDGVESR